MNNTTDHYIETGPLDWTNLAGKQFDLDQVQTLKARRAISPTSNGLMSDGDDSGYMRSVGYLTFPQSITIKDSRWLSGPPGNKINLICSNKILGEFVLRMEYGRTRILIETKDIKDNSTPDKADFIAELFRENYPSVAIVGETRFVSIEIPQEFVFEITKSKRLRVEISDDYITFFKHYKTKTREVIKKKYTH